MRLRVIFVLMLLAIVAAFPACQDGDTLFLPGGTGDDDDDLPGDDDVPGDGDDDTETPDDREYYEMVDPFIGTGGVGFGVGQVVPGPYVPHGMVKTGPDTSIGATAIGFMHCGGYYYYDTRIRMFSLTHMSGIGVPDLGAIGFMPWVRRVGGKLTEDMYRQNLDKSLEFAGAGHYRVTLPETGVRADLTATALAAFHRYTFPETKHATLVINPSHTGSTDTFVEDATITIDPDEGVVYGYALLHGDLTGRFGGIPTYYFARLSRKPDRFGVVQDGETFKDETERAGKNVAGWLSWSTFNGEGIDMKAGVSYVSVERARANLDAQIPGWNFTDVADTARQMWNDDLSVIEVTGGSYDERTMFYTALYHVLTHPTDFTETGGEYMGWDWNVHVADGFRYFSDYSLWDTYRTLHPLMDLIYPDRERDMLVSMTTIYEQSGRIPKWGLAMGETGAMIGTSADLVFAGAYLKGIRDFDVATAWEGLRAHGMGPTPSGRGHVDEYISLGYVSKDSSSGSVSKTLEFSYDDYALYRLAEALGEEEDADRFFRQSKNYKNLYNPANGFFQGRHQDGSFGMLLPRWFGEDYTEGNAWHYLFFVPHDPEGLAELKGGKAELIAALDFFFEKSTEYGDTPLPDVYYWHGNEPDIHTAYMYAMLGEPAKTQKWVRWVLNEKYAAGPDGIDGNDDTGTLSAWYVMSALGIFSIAGSDEYVIGSPVFEKAVIHRDQGDIAIVAENASPENIYIQSATFNGEPLASALFVHDLIADGGEFHFVMGPQPSNWGRF